MTRAIYDIHAADTAHVLCRTIGHAWEIDRTERHPFGRAIITACSRCHSERRVVFTPTGQVTLRGYSYADGYLIGGPPGTRPDRAEFRQELVRRVA